ncbi:histidine phosphotransferase ChpT [Coralliovum pocilloporae]|uniref:histidine phosphotransferase ChpT n=1 Tax=Coralliovum pocilloporae TaxID=3066369 RepID=UPI0033076AFA
MTLNISAHELAALLCSRICHDIISPVGAITNGLEVLEEDGAEDMREFAMDLIHKSARQASAKLQFARIAFGAAGSVGADIDTGDAESVAKGYMLSEKADLSWEGPRLLVPKNRVKLVLNLILISISAVPRGGTIAVRLEDNEKGAEFVIECTGPHARIPNGVEALLDGTPPDGTVDAHSIQPVYTGILAREAGIKLSMSIEGEQVRIEARNAA